MQTRGKGCIKYAISLGPAFLISETAYNFNTLSSCWRACCSKSSLLCARLNGVCSWADGKNVAVARWLEKTGGHTLDFNYTEDHQETG